MSDTQESKDLLKRYAIARIPLIVINSIERSRTLEILKEISEELQLPFGVHTLSKGFYDLKTDKVLNEDKSFYGAVDYISEQMKRKQYVTSVLTEVPDLSTDNNETRTLYDLVSLADETGGTIIIINNNPIWKQLQRQGMLIHVDLPNEEEMYKIVKEYIDNYRHEIPIEWDQNDVREVASILTGATEIEAENVIAALIARKRISIEDIEEVRQAKDRLFSDISGLEKIEVGEDMAEIGGLEGLKKWLDEKKELLSPEKRDELKRLGLQPPRGILLVGVPGCGKSLSAKSISANWKLPLYRLDFATVQGMYVGQSEQQLKDALQTAEDVSPCILWIDEIEKGLTGAGSGSSDVSTRMVGQFLFWLQECKKQVFVVATANDVSKLPSELLRRGRFDELFFIDLPTAQERKNILSIYMRKYLNVDFSGPLADELVQLTEGFTGADLESTVRDLAYRSMSNPNFQLIESELRSAFENVIPLSQTSPETIERIRDWGKTRAVPASNKPIGEEDISKKNSSIRLRKVLV